MHNRHRKNVARNALTGHWDVYTLDANRRACFVCTVETEEAALKMAKKLHVRRRR